MKFVRNNVNSAIAIVVKVYKYTMLQFLKGGHFFAYEHYMWHNCNNIVKKSFYKDRNFF